MESGGAGGGGRCGTGPVNIEALSSTFRMVSAQQADPSTASRKPVVSDVDAKAAKDKVKFEPFERIPLENRPGSKIGEILNV